MPKRGFTLIELLIVIAVISILASLLMPVIAHARQTSQRTVCVSNQRQLTLAWTLYANDYSDRIVANKTQRSPTQSTVDSWVTGSVQLSATDGTRLGLLYSYVGAVAAYHCAADASTNRSYSMSCGLNWFDDSTLREPLPSSYMIRKLGEIAHASLTFVFIDENERSIDDGFFGIDWAPATKFNNMPSTRHHATQTVLSYADEHVSALRWREPKLFVQYEQSVRDAAEQLDLEDLQNQVNQ